MDIGHCCSSHRQDTNSSDFKPQHESPALKQIKADKKRKTENANK